MNTSNRKWNVRGINGVTKRNEVVDALRKDKFKLLAVIERNKMGDGEDVGWSKWYLCKSTRE